MKITFRWYGENDRVTLEKIRQIPVVSGVVSAIYDVPAGAVWSKESIKKLSDACHKNGLEFEVVESVPVHEDIKSGRPNAKLYTENYKTNIRNLAEYGVKCICYNFMPVFDWLRSELSAPLADGSNALAYSHDAVLKMNPLISELSLPGWDASYTREGLKELLNEYKAVDEEALWKNLENFLKEIIPVAESVGIKMAIHPDDPPWGIFGLPRIVTNRANIERLLGLVDSPSNGITLCTGSLGAAKENDLTEIIKTARGRIGFVHLRNIKRSNERDFSETAHPSACGDIDMYGVLKTLKENGFDGYIRPDHGRMIWGETGRYGYGLFDRALGACYIAGLVEAVEKLKIES
ncbi:MAG: mannonate dehydratase [Clostridiales bacterium]|jgi:mannonate dehydratase|nr:mannonate dehydratase [Clostridiales bacterium]